MADSHNQDGNSCLRDSKNNVSFARTAGTFCVVFSMLLVVVTLVYLHYSAPGGNASLIKEFSTSSLYQFLGLAGALYGFSKLGEASADKSAALATSAVPPAPPIPSSALVDKAMPLIEKVTAKVEQMTAKKPADDDESNGSAKAE